MANDLFGPASLNAVTARPAEYRTIGATDTWHKPCSSPSAQDGTQVTAAWLNMIEAQLRRAVRGMGVTTETAADNADDDLLLKAILKATELCVKVADARANMPIFPEIANGVFAFTPTTGQIVVDAGQVFFHRGVFRHSTDDYLLAARTFATAANKTYHLRWRWNAGVPAFALLDLANAGYNPGALAETNALFDTTYDDMLVAKVETNGANALTVTALVNRNRLESEQESTGAETSYDGVSFASVYNHVFALNWARTPIVSATGWNSQTNTPPYLNGHANLVTVQAKTRYSVQAQVTSDWSGTPSDRQGHLRIVAFG